MDASAAPDSFRWRAFFQHCREPLFVLNRRRRIMFANRAWAPLRSQAAARYRLDDWQTAPPAFAPIPAQARLAAASRCPVSLVGERGTGKQWLARAIHHASDRRHLPFIPLDCEH